MKSIFITLIGIAMGAGLMAWFYFQDQSRTLNSDQESETRGATSSADEEPSNSPRRSESSDASEAKAAPIPTGCLEIKLKASDGVTVVGTRFAATVTPSFPSTDSRSTEPREKFRRRSIIEDGKGQVDGLLLNQKIAVELEPLPGTDLRDRSVLIDGPETPDRPATVEIFVSNSAAQPMISGRLVDSQGAVLANQVFEFFCTDFQGVQPKGTQPAPSHSDAEGRFLARLGTSKEAMEVHFVHRRPGQVNLRARLLILDLNSWKTEIGDLQMQEEQLIAKGRVQKANGEGLGGASLRCSYEVIDSGDSEFGKRSALEIIATDSEGYFEVRGLASSKTVVLSPHLKGYHADGGTFPIGSDDIVFEALELAHFAARCSFQKIPVGPYPILLAHRAGQRRAKFFHPIEGVISGELDPGIYSFRLVYSDDKRKSHWERHEVDVAPAAILDLGEIGPEGGPVSCSLKIEIEGQIVTDGISARLRLYDANLGTLMKVEDVRVQDQALHFSCTRFPVRLQCLVRGARIAEVLLEQPEASLKLSPGIPLRLKLKGIDEVVPVKGLFAPVVLTSLFGDPDYLSPRSELANSVFEILLPEPGTYSIGILGMTFNEKDEMTGYAVRATETKVTVPESGLDRVVEVKVEEKVLEELRKRMIPRNWK